MRDPFDLLRDQLVHAAEPTKALRRRRTGPLALLAGTLALTGTAAAAVVSLQEEASAPLAGGIPAGNGKPSTRDYEVELSPSLTAGTTGWCSTISVRRKTKAVVGGHSCGPVPTKRRPWIVAGAIYSPSARSESVAWAVVDARVAAVRLPDGRRVLPRPSSSLPPGWRAVVIFPPAGARPGGFLTDWVFLDQAGRKLQEPSTDRAGTLSAGTASLATHPVKGDSTHPCAITAPPASRLRVASARVTFGIPKHRPNVNGRAFRSCGSAVVRVNRQRFVASVLLDAKHPHRNAPELPGARARQDPSDAIRASGDLTARRIGHAWLVVQGDQADHRLLVLRGLRTGHR